MFCHSHITYDYIDQATALSFLRRGLLRLCELSPNLRAGLSCRLIYCCAAISDPSMHGKTVFAQNTESVKRNGFCVHKCAVSLHHKAKTSKVRDLVYAGPARPSASVIEKIGAPPMAMDVDIETADWVDVKTMIHIGPFGHLCLCSSMEACERILQIAWAFGEAEAGGPSSVNCHIVRPDGFEIAPTGCMASPIKGHKKKGYLCGTSWRTFLRTLLG